MVVVVLVVVGVWWLSGGDPGTSTTIPDDPSTSTSAPGSDPGSAPGSAPTSAPGVAPGSSGPGRQPPVTPRGSDTPPPTGTDPDSGLPYVALADLPPEAGDTVDLIRSGGPYPFERDGSTFFNNEELLPDREEGYYLEFTVITPGSSDRGARRIVEGAGDELYWTADHYDSFERIAE